LNALNNIIMGSPAFQTTILNASKAGADLQSVLVANPLPLFVNGEPAILLTSGSLTVRANGNVVQQDTSGFGLGGYSGIYLTGEGVQANIQPAGVGGSSPSNELSIGRVSGTGANGTSDPENVDLFLSTLDPNGIFTPGASANLSPRVGFIAPVGQSAEYRINGCVIGEQGNCTPTGNPLLNFDLEALIQGPLLSDDEFGDLEDPTITGAPNEEIWRRPE
jgi:hypothetical protein